MNKQSLLISIRGPKEAITAISAGAHIADVEYPASALGTPYPLNIKAVRDALPATALVSTNIGEEQGNRSTACQAALGVAMAGADLIKAGLAGLNYEEAEYLGRNIVRTVKHWFPDKKVYPAVFVDPDLRKIFEPVEEAPRLADNIGADGILIDTFDKETYTLMDCLSLDEIRQFVDQCHDGNLEAWIAGSITCEQLPDIWATGVDVVCIRGAACEETEEEGRFGEVTEQLVRELVNTIQRRN